MLLLLKSILALLIDLGLNFPLVTNDLETFQFVLISCGISLIRKVRSVSFLHSRSRNVTPKLFLNQQQQHMHKKNACLYCKVLAFIRPLSNKILHFTSIVGRNYPQKEKLLTLRVRGTVRKRYSGKVHAFLPVRKEALLS